MRRADQSLHSASRRRWWIKIESGTRANAHRVGAAEGCDLLIWFFGGDWVYIRFCWRYWVNIRFFECCRWRFRSYSESLKNASASAFVIATSFSITAYDTTRYRKEFCQGTGKALKPIQNVGQPSDETQRRLKASSRQQVFIGVVARVLRRHKKADPGDRLKCLILLRNNGRDGVIRTLDP